MSEFSRSHKNRRQNTGIPVTPSTYTTARADSIEVSCKNNGFDCFDIFWTFLSIKIRYGFCDVTLIFGEPLEHIEECGL